MIKFDVAKSAGAVDFDVEALDFFEILATDVTKSEVDEVKIGKHKEVVVTLGIIDTDTSFKIYGEFDVDSFDSKHPNQIDETVKEIEKIVVYDGKKEVFSLSGLKLKADDLANADTLKNYVDKQSFSLTGNNNDNDLAGGSRNDTLSGAGGEDTLTGNAGRDRLTGGADADLFVFASGDGADVVTDFRAKGIGQDHIDLTAYHITFDDITIEAQGRKAFLITFDEGTDSILLEGSGLKLRDIDANDFQF